MNTMNLDKRSVLHIVDNDTKFGAATFLESESVVQVWAAFLTSWVESYVGFLDKVILDQGPQFQSKEFRSPLLAAQISSRDAGIESRNSLGKSERYHAYLRNIFKRVRSEYKKMKVITMLMLAIKAFSNTAGTQGLPHLLLLFRMVPRMPIHPDDLPT